jgi:hypothetical protein
VILYTLLADQESVDTVWNIFYHLSIDQHSYDVLVHQCRRLIDASSSMTTWAQSPFGRIHRMCSSLTLSELRRHWSLYADYQSLPPRRKGVIEAKQRALVQSHKDEAGMYQMLSVSRSAAMYWDKAINPVNNLYFQYQRTGTTFGSQAQAQSATRTNPTFVYGLGGETFSPHRSTFPLQTFHLFSAFAPTTAGEKSEDKSLDHPIVAEVRRQFVSWCSAFKSEIMQSRHFVLRYCVSEALSFCQALALHRTHPSKTGSIAYTQWTMKTLDLDGCVGPTSFDVIDTSNLMDHLGAVNIVLASEPLLRMEATSTLYTESIIPFGMDPIASLTESMYGDLSTMAILLGLAPRALLSGCSTQSTVHEVLWSGKTDGRIQERFAWCRPTGSTSPVSGRALKFNPCELGQMMFRLYDKLLPEERPANVLRSFGKAFGIAHHNRHTVVLAIRSIKSHVTITDTEWQEAMKVFHDSVVLDRDRSVGMMWFQDLFLQLHLHGLYSTPIHTRSWAAAAKVENPVEVFKGWKDVPPVVCLVLVVPPSAFLPFLAEEQIGGLALQCETRHGPGTFYFSSSLQVAPGRVDVIPGRPASVFIEEDPRGAAGLKFAESLVVTLLVPGWIFTMPDTSVSLAFNGTIAAMALARRLGKSLEIFRASISDRRRVHLLPERPTMRSETGSFRNLPPSVPHLSTITYTAQVDGATGVITHVVAKVDLRTAREGIPLPQDAAVVTKQTGPCTLMLSVHGGPVTTWLHFPYPVRGDSTKMRIARKSLYVEVSHSSACLHSQLK